MNTISKRRLIHLSMTLRMRKIKFNKLSMSSIKAKKTRLAT